jgi:hypothetical protein
MKEGHGPGGNMKTVILISSLFLYSCAHKSPESRPKNIAYDSMAQGKVEAAVKKTTKKNDVCFDIELTMKDVSQKDISSSNWTVAWLDQDSRYHLLVLNQRDPASVPEGGPDQWTNNFRTCAPVERLGNVGSLVLTPKTLPFAETEGMTLQWK